MIGALAVTVVFVVIFACVQLCQQSRDQSMHNFIVHHAVTICNGQIIVHIYKYAGTAEQDTFQMGVNPVYIQGQSQQNTSTAESPTYEQVMIYS